MTTPHQGGAAHSIRAQLCPSVCKQAGSEAVETSAKKTIALASNRLSSLYKLNKCISLKKCIDAAKRIFKDVVPLAKRFLFNASDITRSWLNWPQSAATTTSGRGSSPCWKQVQVPLHWTSSVHDIKLHTPAKCAVMVSLALKRSAAHLTRERHIMTDHQVKSPAPAKTGTEPATCPTRLLHSGVLCCFTRAEPGA